MTKLYKKRLWNLLRVTRKAVMLPKPVSEFQSTTLLISNNVSNTCTSTSCFIAFHSYRLFHPPPPNNGRFPQQLCITSLPTHFSNSILFFKLRYVSLKISLGIQLLYKSVVSVVHHCESTIYILHTYPSLLSFLPPTPIPPL